MNVTTLFSKRSPCGQIVILKAAGERGLGVPLSRETTFTVGRSEKSDIRIQDLSVSRKHAQLVWEEDGQLWLENLSKKNAVRLNGQPINKERIKDGDIIEVCGQELRRFKYEASKSSTLDPSQAQKTSNALVNEGEDSIPETRLRCDTIERPSYRSRLPPRTPLTPQMQNTDRPPAAELLPSEGSESVSSSSKLSPEMIDDHAGESEPIQYDSEPMQDSAVNDSESMRDETGEVRMALAGEFEAEPADEFETEPAREIGEPDVELDPMQLSRIADNKPGALLFDQMVVLNPTVKPEVYFQTGEGRWDLAALREDIEVMSMRGKTQTPPRVISKPTPLKSILKRPRPTVSDTAPAADTPPAVDTVSHSMSSFEPAHEIQPADEIQPDGETQPPCDEVHPSKDVQIVEECVDMSQLADRMSAGHIADVCEVEAGLSNEQVPVVLPEQVTPESIDVAASVDESVIVNDATIANEPASASVNKSTDINQLVAVDQSPPVDEVVPMYEIFQNSSSNPATIVTVSDEPAAVNEPASVGQSATVNEPVSVGESATVNESAAVRITLSSDSEFESEISPESSAPVSQYSSSQSDSIQNSSEDRPIQFESDDDDQTKTEKRRESLVGSTGPSSDGSGGCNRYAAAQSPTQESEVCDPVSQEPVVSDLVSHEPVVSALVSHEPVVSELVSQESAVRDPVSQEPAVSDADIQAIYDAACSGIKPLTHDIVSPTSASKNDQTKPESAVQTTPDTVISTEKVNSNRRFLLAYEAGHDVPVGVSETIPMSPTQASTSATPSEPAAAHTPRAQSVQRPKFTPSRLVGVGVGVRRVVQRTHIVSSLMDASKALSTDPTVHPETRKSSQDVFQGLSNLAMVPKISPDTSPAGSAPCTPQKVVSEDGIPVIPRSPAQQRTDRHMLDGFFRLSQSPQSNYPRRESKELMGRIFSDLSDIGLPEDVKDESGQPVSDVLTGLNVIYSADNRKVAAQVEDSIVTALVEDANAPETKTDGKTEEKESPIKVADSAESAPPEMASTSASPMKDYVEFGNVSMDTDADQAPSGPPALTNQSALEPQSDTGMDETPACEVEPAPMDVDFSAQNDETSTDICQIPVDESATPQQPPLSQEPVAVSVPTEVAIPSSDEPRNVMSESFAFSEASIDLQQPDVRLEFISEPSESVSEQQVVSEQPSVCEQPSSDNVEIAEETIHPCQIASSDALTQESIGEDVITSQTMCVSEQSAAEELLPVVPTAVCEMAAVNQPVSENPGLLFPSHEPEADAPLDVQNIENVSEETTESAEVSCSLPQSDPNDDLTCQQSSQMPTEECSDMMAASSVRFQSEEPVADNWMVAQPTDATAHALDVNPAPQQAEAVSSEPMPSETTSSADVPVSESLAPVGEKSMPVDEKLLVADEPSEKSMPVSEICVPEEPMSISEPSENKDRTDSTNLSSEPAAEPSQPEVVLVEEPVQSEMAAVEEPVPSHEEQIQFEEPILSSELVALSEAPIASERLVGPGESVLFEESIESVEQVNFGEQVVQQVEPIEQVDFNEQIEPCDTLEPAADEESRIPIEIVGSSSEPDDATERLEPVEQMEPIQQGDMTEPVEMNQTNSTVTVEEVVPMNLVDTEVSESMSTFQDNVQPSEDSKPSEPVEPALLDLGNDQSEVTSMNTVDTEVCESMSPSHDNAQPPEECLPVQSTESVEQVSLDPAPEISDWVDSVEVFGVEQPVDAMEVDASVSENEAGEVAPSQDSEEIKWMTASDLIETGDVNTAAIDEAAQSDVPNVESVQTDLSEPVQTDDVPIAETDQTDLSISEPVQTDDVPIAETDQTDLSISEPVQTDDVPIAWPDQTDLSI
eukprot:933263_1